jgi:hypothetical protein
VCCCRTTSQTIKALKAAGFEVLEACDLTTTADIAWWDPVDPDQWWRLQSEWADVLPGLPSVQLRAVPTVT